MLRTEICMNALTIFLVAVDVRFRVAVVVNLDVCRKQLWHRQLCITIIQQLLQLLLIQLTGGGWEEQRWVTFN